MVYSLLSLATMKTCEDLRLEDQGFLLLLNLWSWTNCMKYRAKALEEDWRSYTNPLFTSSCSSSQSWICSCSTPIPVFTVPFLFLMRGHACHFFSTFFPVPVLDPDSLFVFQILIFFLFFLFTFILLFLIQILLYSCSCFCSFSCLCPCSWSCFSSY